MNPSEVKKLYNYITSRIDLSSDPTINYSDWEKWVGTDITQEFIRIIRERRFQALQDILELSSTDSLTKEFYSLKGSIEILDNILSMLDDLSQPEENIGDTHEA